MDEVVEAMEKYQGLVPLVYDAETMALEEARPQDMPYAVYLKREADKVIAHQKYKRCLAMAKWCFDEGKGTPTVYEVRTFYWGRWGNIWLALAEEPTWAKFLQLIHKEAK